MPGDDPGELDPDRTTGSMLIAPRYCAAFAPAFEVMAPVRRSSATLSWTAAIFMTTSPARDSLDERGVGHPAPGSASPPFDARCRSTICYPMADVSFPAAFAAGLICLFRRACCRSARYLCYLAGRASKRWSTRARPRRGATSRHAFAVAGFSTVFVASAPTASALGELFTMEPCLVHRGRIGVILMGLQFLGVFRSTRCCVRSASRSRNRRVYGAPIRWASPSRWLDPLVGPILATSLAVAGSRHTVASGAALLAVYSLGLGCSSFAPAAIGPVHARVPTYASIQDGSRPSACFSWSPASRSWSQFSDVFTRADRDVATVRSISETDEEARRDSSFSFRQCLSC